MYFCAKTAFWAGFWGNLPINKLFVQSCSCVPAYPLPGNLPINKPGAISLPFLLGRFLGGEPINKNSGARDMKLYILTILFPQ